MREQVVIIAKGVHTPCNYPHHLRPQLLETLERLQTDYADIYLAHRDNPQVPVGEWVDAFNQELRAGRIRAFGGSNWTLERVQAANEYARSKGLVGMAAVSNHLSLARIVTPPWAGALAADADLRSWLEATQTPLFAWSAQARGFFAGRKPMDEDPEAALLRHWDSADNLERLERAHSLAQRKRVSAAVIALAYVLHQPFPVFALIGPRTLAEMGASFEALEVELTPQEMRWLNLEQ